jgi:hypothetical protein
MPISTKNIKYTSSNVCTTNWNTSSYWCNLTACSSPIKPSGVELFSETFLLAGQGHLITSQYRSTYAPLSADAIRMNLLRTVTDKTWGHYATSRKVAGSSPDKVVFFNLPNPSSRNMALRSTQTVTEMSTTNLPR